MVSVHFVILLNTTVLPSIVLLYLTKAVAQPWEGLEFPHFWHICDDQYVTLTSELY